jgi:hypothetical protein
VTCNCSGKERRETGREARPAAGATGQVESVHRKHSTSGQYGFQKRL